MNLPSDVSEDARALALRQYEILDTKAEEAFDDLTRLASTICQAPISLITLLDGNRQWFKSANGLDLSEAALKHSFCTHAVAAVEEVMVVENALVDDRFKEGNPLVEGYPNIRAYAGAPLVTVNGVPLGTLCVIDTEPRQFDASQRQALQVLSKQVMAQLELRLRVRELEEQQAKLISLNQQLDQFAYIISHDLKAPIRHQSSFAKLIVEDFGNQLPAEAKKYLDFITKAGDKAQQMLMDLDEYVRTVQTAYLSRHPVVLRQVLEEARQLAGAPPHLTVTVEAPDYEVLSNATALRHILLNLLGNAIKYNDRPDGRVWLSATRQAKTIRLVVRDNGPGVADADAKRIFELFGRGATDQAGRGMGLTIAARLAQNLNGHLWLEPQDGAGATFVAELPVG